MEGSIEQLPNKRTHSWEVKLMQMTASHADSLAVTGLICHANLLQSYSNHA